MRMHILKRTETRIVKEKISKVEDIVYGRKSRRVAVLGAFDTWPYMDFISRHLTKMHYVAITSRYIYRFDKANNKTIRIDNTPEPDEFMVDFLHKIILMSPRAVVIYSVPAGHFIETDWCYRNRMNTLGLALVRKIGEKMSREQCSDLIVFEEFGYSLCKSTKTAFDCIESGSCPFKEQGISKNVIEYFLRARPSHMVLTAVENINVIPTLLKKWLQRSLLSS